MIRRQKKYEVSHEGNFTFNFRCPIHTPTQKPYYNPKLLQNYTIFLMLKKWLSILQLQLPFGGCLGVVVWSL
jgi:hypothetical protein